MKKEEGKITIIKKSKFTFVVIVSSSFKLCLVAISNDKRSIGNKRPIEKFDRFFIKLSYVNLTWDPTKGT